MATNTDSKQSRVIRSFVQATVSTCHSLCGIDAHAGPPFVKRPAEAFYGISAILGLNGSGSGVVVLTMSDTCGPRMIGRIAGSDFAAIDANVVDGVREIINIIAGKARGMLDSQGITFEISIPKVVVGQNYIPEQDGNVKTVVIPFHTEAGEFYLEISLRAS